MSYDNEMNVTGKACVNALLTRTIEENRCNRHGDCFPHHKEESIELMLCENVYNGADEFAANDIMASLNGTAEYYGGSITYANPTLYPPYDTNAKANETSARRFNNFWNVHETVCKRSDDLGCAMLRSRTMFRGR